MCPIYGPGFGRKRYLKPENVGEFAPVCMPLVCKPFRLYSSEGAGHRSKKLQNQKEHEHVFVSFKHVSRAITLTCWFELHRRKNLKIEVFDVWKVEWGPNVSN